MADHYGFNDQRGPYKGVRVVITTNEDTPPATYDGVTLNVGDPVLLVGQTNKEENGLREVGPSTWAIWRYMKLDEEIKQGMLVHVAEGTSYGGSYWRLDTAGPYVLDTTELEFSLAFWPAAVGLSVADFSSDQTVLVAVTAANPAAQVVGEGEFVGRKTGGDVGVMTVAEAKAELEAITKSDYNAQTVLIAVADDDPGPLTIGEGKVLGRLPSGNLGALDYAPRFPEIVSVGGAHTDTVAVSIKAVDAAGSTVAAATPFTWCLSSSATTGAPSGTTPDGGVAISPGLKRADNIAANIGGVAMTHTDGTSTLTVNHVGGAVDYYLWLEIGGHHVVSTVIEITA